MFTYYTQRTHTVHVAYFNGGSTTNNLCMATPTYMIRDEAGTVLGVTTAQGNPEDYVKDGRSIHGCVWRGDIKVPKRTHYEVMTSATQAHGVIFSYSEIKSLDWRADIVTKS